jgi:hypothetical protein
LAEATHKGKASAGVEAFASKNFDWLIVMPG